MQTYDEAIIGTACVPPGGEELLSQKAGHSVLGEFARFGISSTCQVCRSNCGEVTWLDSAIGECCALYSTRIYGTIDQRECTTSSPSIGLDLQLH